MLLFGLCVRLGGIFLVSLSWVLAMERDVSIMLYEVS